VPERKFEVLTVMTTDAIVLRAVTPLIYLSLGYSTRGPLGLVNTIEELLEGNM
jgi:hypothetical protein